MTHRLGLKSCAIGAAALVAVSACGKSGTTAEADPSVSPSIATSNSTGAASAPVAPVSASEPSAIAATAATALIHRYFATIDRISQDPASALGPLSAVAVGTELSGERHFLGDEHKRGERQVGSTRIAALTVQAVNLDDSPAAGHVPTVTVDVCWDVSHADVLGRDGKSVVSAKRPDTGWTRYSVANYHYVANPSSGWRVASAQDLRRTPCAAS